VTTVRSTGPLDQLAAAMDALDPASRLHLAQQTLAIGGNEALPRPIRDIVLALHRLTRSTEPAELAVLVAALKAGPPGTLLTVADIAGDAAAGAAGDASGYAAMWTALRELCWAVGA
jgi:hypothetical protein